MLWHNKQGKVIKPWQYKNFATIFFQLSLYLSFPINFFSQWTANSKYKKHIKYILERFHHVAKCTTKCCISCQRVSFTLADLKLDFDLSWIIFKFAVIWVFLHIFEIYHTYFLVFQNKTFLQFLQGKFLTRGKQGDTSYI